MSAERELSLSARFLGSAIPGIDGTYEPQRTNAGYILFDGGFFARNYLLNQEKVLVLAIDNFDLPKFTFNHFDMHWNNEKRSFVSSIDVEDLTLNFRDFVDVPVAELFDKWMYLIYNEYNGAINFKYQYSCEALFVLLGPDGKISRYYRSSGVYPIRVDYGNIDHNSSDFVKIEITIAAGKIYRIPKNELNKWRGNIAGGTINSIDLQKLSLLEYQESKPVIFPQPQPQLPV